MKGSEVMYCTKCGTKIENGAKFCTIFNFSSTFRTIHNFTTLHFYYIMYTLRCKLMREKLISL